jgi:HEAT repeat protein
VSESNGQRADEAVWQLRHMASQAVYDKARALCFSTNARAREVGVCILSQLGIPDRVFSEESAALFLQMLDIESNESVVEAICYGFGHLQSEEGEEALVKLSRHHNPDIRLGAAHGLTGQNSDTALRSLIDLSTDKNAEIRDWATFALGSMTDVDSEEVRNALFERLFDDSLDVKGEALSGLARRQDPRVSSLIADELACETVGFHPVEAAFYMPRGEYLPLLKKLCKNWTINSRLLNEAIEKCSKQ